MQSRFCVQRWRQAAESGERISGTGMEPFDSTLYFISHDGWHTENKDALQMCKNNAIAYTVYMHATWRAIYWMLSQFFASEHNPSRRKNRLALRATLCKKFMATVKALTSCSHDEVIKRGFALILVGPSTEMHAVSRIYQQLINRNQILLWHLDSHIADCKQQIRKLIDIPTSGARIYLLKLGNRISHSRLCQAVAEATLICWSILEIDSEAGAVVRTSHHTSNLRVEMTSRSRPSVQIDCHQGEIGVTESRLWKKNRRSRKGHLVGCHYACTTFLLHYTRVHGSWQRISFTQRL